ncbi:peptidoglycan DD-metalloendopeptidase family protein, partial [Ligilactobacillus salivarius]|uniref:peptidoglycan DD-metalloendopeptidase family protein n=1 Tax=Ligilactobacillus salivarius TaxID=1624 RepID=UPI0022E647CA
NKDGQLQYGQQAIGNHWYLFDKSSGAMQTGFQNLAPYGQNKTVYYASNGQMQYGQKQIGGHWYLFDKSSGAMQIGLQNLAPYGQNKVVYYASNGQMQYGQQVVGNHWYLFDTYSGAMLTGFQNLAPYGQDKTAYYNKDGQLQYGSQVINGKKYYFDKSSGKMYTGVAYNPDTKTIQYYALNGQMQVGKVNIAGKVYNFDSNTGNLLMQGLVTLDGKNYLLDSNHKVLTGQQVVGNHWYLFSKYDGSMQTGFQNLAPYGQNKTVYYASNGQMQYGQKAVGNHWYLFDKSSGAMQTGFQNLAPYGQNKTVYYASNGQMQYGWQNINGKDYYFDTISGAMKTGTVNINGKNYTFNSDGTLKKDTWGWPFPSVGQGSFTGAQLFGVNPGGEFRMNGFHDGLDFGSYDHPGSSVHAVHSGVVTQIGYIAGLENYVVVQSDEYSFVYQEAFSNRGNIKVHVGQQINTGDVIGYRDTSHLHLGITREKNIMRAIANSFNNNGTWLNPLELIRNGIANQ